MLDNILEESVDQHFQGLIHSRHIQRRREVIDDNMAAEVIEENAESIWEPPEVQNSLVFSSQSSSTVWEPILKVN